METVRYTGEMTAATKPTTSELTVSCVCLLQDCTSHPGLGDNRDIGTRDIHTTVINTKRATKINGKILEADCVTIINMFI